LAGETEVLGENLPQRHFVHHKSTSSVSDEQSSRALTFSMKFLNKLWCHSMVAVKKIKVVDENRR
jgi:hypothetical protein